jgi:hypothetical protein
LCESRARASIRFQGTEKARAPTAIGLINLSETMALPALATVLHFMSRGAAAVSWKSA